MKHTFTNKILKILSSCFHALLLLLKNYVIFFDAAEISTLYAYTQIFYLSIIFSCDSLAVICEYISICYFMALGLLLLSSRL